MLYETLGAAPNRVFIAQWDNVGTFDDSSANLTFQAWIYEAGSNMEFHYDELTDGTLAGFDASGGGATVGVEGFGGIVGTEISCDVTGAITTATAYRITAEDFQVVRTATTPNPGAFVADPAGGPFVGTNWGPTVTGALPSPVIDAVIVSLQPGIEAPVPFGTLLCVLNSNLLQFNFTPGTPFSIVIPNDCSLVGQILCTQGGSVSFAPLTIGLANALDCLVGSN